MRVPPLSLTHNPVEDLPFQGEERQVLANVERLVLHTDSRTHDEVSSNPHIVGCL
jgi:hypothetical protein